MVKYACVYISPAGNTFVHTYGIGTWAEALDWYNRRRESAWDEGWKFSIKKATN